MIPYATLPPGLYPAAELTPRWHLAPIEVDRALDVLALHGLGRWRDVDRFELVHAVPGDPTPIRAALAAQAKAAKISLHLELFRLAHPAWSSAALRAVASAPHAVYDGLVLAEEPDRFEHDPWFEQAPELDPTPDAVYRALLPRAGFTVRLSWLFDYLAPLAPAAVEAQLRIDVELGTLKLAADTWNAGAITMLPRAG